MKEILHFLKQKCRIGDVTLYDRTEILERFKSVVLYKIEEYTKTLYEEMQYINNDIERLQNLKDYVESLYN